MVFFTVGGDNHDNTDAVQATKQFECTLTFEGFYNTSYGELVSDFIEQEQAYLSDCGASVAELDLYAEKLTDSLDFGKLHEYIAKQYVEAVQDWVNEYLPRGESITLHFKELISPREYNFTTDVITVGIEACDVNTLYNFVTPAKFAAFVEIALTPCEGFAPYYSADVNQWPHFTEWTPAQRGVLLDCLLQAISDKAGVKNLSEQLTAYELMPDFYGSGQLTNAIWQYASEEFRDYANKLSDKQPN
jgi:hypothetical protein